VKGQRSRTARRARWRRRRALSPPTCRRAGCMTKDRPRARPVHGGSTTPAREAGRVARPIAGWFNCFSPLSATQPYPESGCRCVNRGLPGRAVAEGRPVRGRRPGRCPAPRGAAATGSIGKAAAAFEARRSVWTAMSRKTSVDVGFGRGHELDERGGSPCCGGRAGKRDLQVRGCRKGGRRDEVPVRVPAERTVRHPVRAAPSASARDPVARESDEVVEVE
jgi:hypothetical protein